MIVEKLNSGNRTTLKENIAQLSGMYLSILVVAIILLGALYIASTEYGFPNLPFKPIWIFWGSSILFGIIYSYFLFRTFKIPFLDLFKGNKIIQYDTILEKRVNTKYTGEFKRILLMPRTEQTLALSEYFLKFKEYELQVDAKVFELFHKGDEVKLSLSFYSNKVIQIEKN